MSSITKQVLDLKVSLFNAAVENNKDDFLIALPQCVHELKESPQIIHIVCSNGWLDVAKELITNYNMNPNIAMDIPDGVVRGATCLHFACISGNIELVEYLISVCCCNVYRHTDDELTVLHCAVIGGVRVVKHMVNLPNVAPMFLYNASFIMWCGYYHWDNDLVKYLIVEHKCSIIINDDTGDTILHYACRDGHIERLKFLVTECNCDIHVTNSKNGDTLLHTICFSYDELPCRTALDILTFLIEKFKTESSFIPLRLSLPSKWAQVMISYYSSRFEFTSHILSHAYQHWNVTVMKFFLSEMRYAPITNVKTGDTVMHMACREMRLDKLKFLIEDCNCDGLSHDHSLNTLLHAFSTSPIHPCKELLSYLKSKCISYNSIYWKNTDSFTPLKWAICHPSANTLPMVRCLVEEYGTHELYTEHTLLLMCQYWSNDLMKYLLVEMNYCLKNGPTAVSNVCSILCKNGEFTKLEFLINECQVHIHDTDIKGTTICYMHPNRQCSSSQVVVGVAECSLLDLFSSAICYKRPLSLVFLFEKCNLNLQQDLLDHTSGFLNLAYSFWDDNIIKYLLLKIKSAQITPIVDNGSGDTILHRACQAENINHVKFLIERCDCNPTHIANCKDETIIHIACQSFDILQYLCIECNCCPDLSDDHWVGTIAMKSAISQKKEGLAVVQHLVEKCRVKDNSEILSAVYEHLCPDIVKYLIMEANFDMKVRSKVTAVAILYRSALDHKRLQYLTKAFYSPVTNGELLIHAACYYTSLIDFDILQYLCINCNCCPDLSANQEQVGTITMKSAIAQRERGLTVIKHLVQKCKVIGNTEIMSFVYEHWCPDIVKYLIMEAKFDLAVSISENILSLCAKNKKNEQLRFLFEACHLPITHEMATYIIQHMIPLSTYDSDISYLLKYLFMECKCIVTVSFRSIVNLLNYCCVSEADNLSLVALHLIETCGGRKNSSKNNKILRLLVSRYFMDFQCLEYSPAFLSLIDYLIYDCCCDVTSQDVDGNTVLHLACTHFMGDISLIERIMSTGKADPLCFNQCKETPLMLLDRSWQWRNNAGVKVSQIEQLICRFGEVKIAHPIHLYTSVVILGNPGAGKSTLAKVIKDRHKYTIAPSLWNVKGVELHTAGIIPNVLNDKDIGRIILHDLAGQAEYYSSHTAVLENLLQGSAAVFVLVVSLADTNVIKSFQQWLNIIENVSHNALYQCHLIVVASHADQSVVDDLDQLKKSIRTNCSIESTNQGNSIMKIHDGLFTLDCRKPGGGQLVKFISALSTACKSITDNDTREMSLYCHMLYDFLQRDGKSVYTLHELVEQSATKDNGLFLPKDVSQIDKIILQLNATGLIVFLQNPLELTKSWIVADKAVLLRDLNGVLFAPPDFKQHVSIASNTGVVKLSDLHSIFPKYDTALLLQFLQYMELCSVISSKFIRELDSRQRSANVIIDIDLDQYIFIPALITNCTERPVIVNEALFKFGWCLRCSGSNFFLFRFLHLLQLRLTCKFAAIFKSDSTFERYCELWTKGVYWKDTKGVEALVEVVDSNQAVVVLLSCEDGAKKTDMLNLIHDVLAEVLSCKQQVMPRVVTNEYIIVDSSYHKISIGSLANIPSYKVDLLARSFIENNRYILNDKLQSVEISKILASETCDQDEICMAIFAGRDPQDIINMKDAPIKLTREDAPIFAPSEVTAETEVHVEVNPCSQILKSHTPKILELVDPLKFANELLSVGLLTDRTLETIITITGVDRYEKANYIMNDVSRHLRTFTPSERPKEMETFRRFCEVLKDQHDDLLTEISKEMMDRIDGL